MVRSLRHRAYVNNGRDLSLRIRRTYNHLDDTHRITEEGVTRIIMRVHDFKHDLTFTSIEYGDGVLFQEQCAQTSWKKMPFTGVRFILFAKHLLRRKMKAKRRITHEVFTCKALADVIVSYF